MGQPFNSKRVPMPLSEQKAVMLQILITFADFCNTNNLMYFLDAGTLLGAVRHQGYIPWDDDIDVNLLRQDYEKFVELTKKTGGRLSEHIYVEYAEDTIFPFIKLADDRTTLIEYPEKNPMEVAVYIDVFPKDGIRDASLSSRITCQVSYCLNLCRWFGLFSVNAWKRSVSRPKRLMAAFGKRILKHPDKFLRLQQKWIQRNNKKHPISTCKYVTTLVNGEFHKIAPKECFQEAVLMEFEGIPFRVPVGYDTYLRCLYPGDYMEIPPVEKREVHDTYAYWNSEKDKTDFLNSLSPRVKV